MLDSKTATASRLNPIAAGILAAMAFTPLANAQQAEPTKQAEKNDDVIEMIVVTARKRDERQIDVPISMSAVTGEQMEDRGILNVTDIMRQTPGVSATEDGGGVGSVQIRGVSTSLGGNENGYYIDEMPFTGVTTNIYPDTRSWDLERVEVLKGPQGTLFGEGSMGGTVRIISKAPDLTEFGAKVAVNGSSVADGSQGRGVKGMVNVPIINDKLALRVAVTDESTPGWIDSSATGEENINDGKVRTGRAKLRFAPTDRLTIDLSHWQSKTQTDNATASALDDMTSALGNSPMINEWSTDSLTATYDFDSSELVLVASDSSFDILTKLVSPVYEIAANINIGVRTNELRWASTGEHKLDWTLGYYQREAVRDDIATGVLHIAPGVDFDYNSGSGQTNDAYAVFGETTLHLNDRWDLTAGLRYFSDDVNASSVDITGATNTLNDTFDSVNPRVALSYKPADDTTVYLSAAKGFRSGQLQPITSVLTAQAVGIPLETSIDPDTILTYELGAKSLLADGKLLVEGAVYHSDWKDVAVRVQLIPGLGGIANSPGSTSLGMDLSVSYNPVQALTLQLGAGWVDATYQGDVPGTGFTDGVQVYNVPKTTLTSSASYMWDLGSALTAVAYAGVNYRSALTTNALASTNTPGDALTTATARLSIESPTGWSAALFGSNLTNEDGAVTPPNTIGYSQRLQPRTIGLEASYAF